MYNSSHVIVNQEVIFPQIVQYIFALIGFTCVTYYTVSNIPTISPPEGFEYDSDEDKCD